jgi:hypothetical protein
MQPCIRVKFERMPSDPSVESSVHRWVARLDSPDAPVRAACVTIEQAGRRHTAVTLKLLLADGFSATAATSHGDIYVAVADAFRAARRQLLARRAPDRAPRLALSLA